jgi:hypothetical protein
MDSCEERCPDYRAILDLRATWQDSCRPIISREGDPCLTKRAETAGGIEEWMKEPRAIFTHHVRNVQSSGYMLVRWLAGA